VVAFSVPGNQESLVGFVSLFHVFAEHWYPSAVSDGGGGFEITPETGNACTRDLHCHRRGMFDSFQNEGTLDFDALSGVYIYQ
jgi:hypothetical protein